MDTLVAEKKPERKAGIPGSTLKLIAIITMLIDHTAATILERMMQHQGIEVFSVQGIMEPISIMYLVMRIIGRLGFPIFIFLLIEGLEHTRNRWKYLLRLVLFAAVSEIPFDFAFNLKLEQIMSGQLVEWGYQNVFFTLSIGLLTIIGIQAIQVSGIAKWLQVLSEMGITIVGMIAAYLLHTDYDAVGILAIVMMYLLRKNRILATAVSCIVLVFSSFLEMAAFLILIPISCYNGTRGWKLKWVFYIFYPAHLFILWLICWGMGIA